ncbi:RNA polymerase sigma factor [Aurantibacter sp.]|uniref:RNA polymerase sigma factor n=1 Tax=Aurantibacter sp. TaxID=2807103 RepID=UPI0035C7A7F5
MTETEFIEALILKSPKAYSKLLDDYQQKVFSTCISFVPNTEDAEDIAQDVFIEVFNSIHKFKGNSKLSTWIYRITTNKCLEFIRKHKTKKRFGFLQSLFSEDFSIDKTNYHTDIKHPGIVLEQKETSATIFKAINTLPEQQRLVFTLHKIDGKSYKEISEIIEKSINSVESLMHRAKHNLKQKLDYFYKNEF